MNSNHWKNTLSKSCNLCRYQCPRESEFLIHTFINIFAIKVNFERHKAQHQKAQTSVFSDFGGWASFKQMTRFLSGGHFLAFRFTRLRVGLVLNTSSSVQKQDQRASSSSSFVAADETEASSSSMLRSGLLRFLMVDSRTRFNTLPRLGLSIVDGLSKLCLLYTSPSPRDQRGSRMPSSA